MKKLLYILLAMTFSISCSHRKQSILTDSKDSMVTVYAMRENLEIPLDSFLHIKDSFVYVEDAEFMIPSSFWATKEYYKWNFGYPDTITVLFPGDKDSLKAVRSGIVHDKNGKTYSPAYVFHCAVGILVWDVNGKYIRYSMDDPKRDRDCEYYEY